MILSADYHTHTIYSHGKKDIIDNAISAKNKGLLELGISDHGFAHPAFGLRIRKLSEMREKIENAKKETGVNVLLGIESNIIGIDGTTDLKPCLYDKFDIFLAGIHKFVMYKFGAYFSLFLPNFFNSSFKCKNIPKSLVKRNTKTYINVIKKNPVDVITHPNFCCFADAYEVAKACADYGTYFELNAKKDHLTDDEIEKILKTGVRFVIGSDGHTPERVGEISRVENLIKRMNFPIDRIDNIDGRLPKFRFKSFKESAGR